MEEGEKEEGEQEEEEEQEQEKRQEAKFHVVRRYTWHGMTRGTV